MKFTDVKRDDLDKIWSLIETDSFGLNRTDLEEELVSSAAFVSLEDIGFAYVKIDSSEAIEECSVSIFVKENMRRQGYGSLLLKEVERRVKNDTQQSFKIENLLRYNDASKFLLKHGYEMWFSSSLMEYHHKAFETIKPEIINNLHTLDENLYDQFRPICSEAFYELRKENHIEPYYIELSEDDKNRMLDNRDEYAILKLQNQVVGGVQVTKEHLSLFIVGKAYSGLGYGSELVKYATNRVLDAGYEVPRLFIMDTNIGARRLYESLGYQLVSTTHVYRK